MRDAGAKVIERTDFGDVTRLRMVSWQSRLVQYDVSGYLVRGVLIDTGPWHVRHELPNVLQDLQVRGVVVTHWHEDHAGNVPVLAFEATPLWIAPETERKLRAPFHPRLYRRFTWGAPARLSAAVIPFDPAPLRVIHTPGHSHDHHVVFDEETGTLLSADLWLGARAAIVGEDENPYQIIESLGRAIALKPRRMFDAHRGEVREPVRALEARRSWLSATIGSIELRLDAGDPESAILKELLGGEDVFGWLSRGEYSRVNLIRAVARDRALKL